MSEPTGTISSLGIHTVDMVGNDIPVSQASSSAVVLTTPRITIPVVLQNPTELQHRRQQQTFTSMHLHPSLQTLVSMIESIAALEAQERLLRHEIQTLEESDGDLSPWVDNARTHDEIGREANGSRTNPSSLENFIREIFEEVADLQDELDEESDDDVQQFSLRYSNSRVRVDAQTSTPSYFQFNFDEDDNDSDDDDGDDENRAPVSHDINQFHSAMTALRLIYQARRNHDGYLSDDSGDDSEDFGQTLWGGRTIFFENGREVELEPWLMGRPVIDANGAQTKADVGSRDGNSLAEGLAAVGFCTPEGNGGLEMLWRGFDMDGNPRTRTEVVEVDLRGAADACVGIRTLGATTQCGR
ncbi:hypothetical protein HDU84_006249 [Entophlyctis sp. JEL0112]|nr:hypothetical protein HDU84_006249 [Entophlyctis sp. JEL0112]